MNQNTIELAIAALEAERTRIAGAIAELKGGLSGSAITRAVAVKAAAGAAPAARQGKRRLSAAGRAALAAAAKRRWAKAKAAGKSRL